MDIVDLPASHFADACALWSEAGLTRPWNDPESDLLRAVQGPDSTVLACLDDRGALAGTAMVGHDGHRGWVYYLAVAPTARGRGLATRLMRACESWVADRGIGKIQLMVRTGNSRVVGFYERLGYERNDVVVLGRRLGS